MLFWVALLLLPAWAQAELTVTPQMAAVYENVYIEETDEAGPWHFGVIHEGKLLFEREDDRISGCFLPEWEGEYTFFAENEKSRHEKQFTVMKALNAGDGTNIRLLGEQDAFYTQGGVRSYVVKAPGSWTAETRDAFIHLRMQEHVLTVLVDNSRGQYREGSIVIRCGDESSVLDIVQLSGRGTEEEAYLQDTRDQVLIEGESCVSWLEASGEKTWSVSASGPWEAVCSADFVHVEAGEKLRIRVDEPAAHQTREAWVMLSCGQASAYVYIQQTVEPEYTLDERDAICAVGQPEISLYSQQDGTWQNDAYRHSNLEQSGCAIFTLSHALQLLGWEEEEVLPQRLAATYASCLLEGGTLNSALIGRAAKDFGFRTRYDLYHNLREIQTKMQSGAVYSFSVVSGHIALVAGVTEDKSKFLIYDSAPSATFERIQNASMYILDDTGAFVTVQDLKDIPGCCYYLQTGAYGGCMYYLDAAYVAQRGVRLIQPRAE